VLLPEHSLAWDEPATVPERASCCDGPRAGQWPRPRSRAGRPRPWPAR
jgi:hypothetical protein